VCAAGPDTPDQLCDVTVPVCGSTIPAGAPVCRVAAQNLIISGPEIAPRAPADGGADIVSRLAAIFPFSTGQTTALSAAILAADTELTVDALKGYPNPPWEAVIDRAGTPETVTVTKIVGTTLTVVRGQANTAAAPHAAGQAFDQRFIDSGLPKDLTAKDGLLATVTISTPQPIPDMTAFTDTSRQLQANGDFDVNGPQQITRLTAFNTLALPRPTLVWTSSHSTVAFVSNASFTKGLVTAFSECGGTTMLRARADTSDTTLYGDDSTNDPAVDTDNDACDTDPLCDEVCVTVQPQAVLPYATACDATLENPDPAPVDCKCDASC
jgi:hypothetical protein